LEFLDFVPHVLRSIAYVLICLLTVAIPGQWWSKQLHLGKDSVWWWDAGHGEWSLGPGSVYQG